MKKRLIFFLSVAFVFMYVCTSGLDATSLSEKIRTQKVETTGEDSKDLKEAELEEWTFEEEDNGEMLKARSATASSGLSIPVEGSWDSSKTKDIKDSSGKVIEKRFYSSKNVLMEKRFYRYSGSTRIMDEKYLYWSDGKTLERERIYGYISSSDKYYIEKTTKYRDNATRQWILNYTGKNSDIYENQFVYNQEGTYSIYKVLYNGKTSNIQTTRIYYQGYATNGVNLVTHVGDYNSAGTKWIRVTYYSSYTNDIKTRIVKYNGDDPDNKVVYIWYYEEDGKTLRDTTYYDSTGQYISYKTKYRDGLKKERTFYNLDAAGKKQRTLYYDDVDDTNVLNIKYFNNEGTVIKELYYENYPHRTKEILYYDDEKLKEETLYQGENNIKDVVTKWNQEEKETEKYRYFKDGEKLRWEIEFVDGKKESVNIYDNNTYQLKENYKYTEIDKDLDKQLTDIKDDLYVDVEEYVSYLSIFNNEALAKYISDYIGVNIESPFFIEDVKIIDEIIITNANQMAEEYSILPEGEDDILEEIEESEDGGEFDANGKTTENDEEVKSDVSYSIFDTLDGIGYLSELKILKINNGLLSDVPDEIETLKKLKELDLANNNILEVSLKLNDLTNLEKVDFSNNNLKSTEKYLANLVNLKEINLQNNPNILYLSNDLVSLKTNNSGINIKMDSNVNYKDSDISNYDAVYNLNYFNIPEGLLKIDNTLVSKIFEDDSDIEYFDSIIPNFTKDIISDLNSKNVGTGNIEVCYVSDKIDYSMSVENNNITLNKENTSCLETKTFSITDDIDNSEFENKGFYIVYVNVDYKKLSIEHSIILKKYDTTVEQEMERLEQSENNDNILVENEINLDLEDSDNLLVSQSELNDFEIEEESFSQLEDLENTYDIVNMDGYAGAYLDSNNNIVIQFTSNKTSKSKSTMKSSLAKQNTNQENKIIFKDVTLSQDQLEEKSNYVMSNVKDIKIIVSIDSKENKLVIEVDRSNSKALTSQLSQLSGISKNEYVIKISDNIQPAQTAKSVYMATAYKREGDSGSYATFGFRVKKKQFYCVKKKNGKCKKDKNGKIVYSKKYKWVYGATIPYHDKKSVGTKYYSGSIYVGKKYKRSKSTDTDMVRFNSKYAKPLKKISKYGKYSYASSSSDKVVVEGAKIWKIYRSIHDNRKLVSGKIVYTNVTVNGIEKNIGAKIKNTYGDSGGPLVRKYKGKSYVIGTSHAGAIDDKGASSISYYNNSSDILKKLNAKSY